MNKGHSAVSVLSAVSALSAQQNQFPRFVDRMDRNNRDFSQTSGWEIAHCPDFKAAAALREMSPNLFAGVSFSSSDKVARPSLVLPILNGQAHSNS